MLRGLFAGLLVVCAIVGCGNEATQKLMLTGSSTVAPVMQEIAQAFEQTYPDIQVDVQTGGSTRGITDAMSHIADLGMVSRSLSVDEGQYLTAHTLAYDGIAIVVHASNPMTNLTSQQVKDIYAGTLNNWSSLGGRDEGIVVIHKAEGRSTNELFLQYFELASQHVIADVVIGDNQQGINTLAANPNGIAYLSIGAAKFEIESGVPIKFLQLDGVTPTMQSILAGDFPLIRPLNLVVEGVPSPSVNALLQYTSSSAAKKIIDSHFFVSSRAQ